MFRHNEVFGSMKIEAGSTLISSGDSARPSKQRALPHRLAELVHHLSDAPVGEARRAVHLSGQDSDLGDPLSIVAAALVQLRHNPSRCVGA